MIKTVASAFPDGHSPHIMKTLILPAEIYSREFDARLLHGLIALSRGWRVFVGSKALINRAIWRLPRGIYLCQTLTHKRRSMLKLLNALGYICVGWDEEGLLYLDRDVYLMRRVSIDTLKHLQSIVAWGQQSAEDVEHRSRDVGLAPLALGNPRIDLVRPELHRLYAAEVAAIKARHGRFVLINTNFAGFNPVISIHDLKVRKTSRSHQPSKTESARFASVQAHRKQVYERFLVDLPVFTRRHPDLNFVLRAHPGEKEETWLKAFSGQKNVVVTREGTAAPWLIAADALVHNGCTTAVEAAIAGMTPICFCPIVSFADESPLPNPISHRAGDLTELAHAIRSSAERALAMDEQQVKVLTRHVSAIDGKLASDAIMDHLENIHQSAASADALKHISLRAFAILRHAFKALRRDHITDRYLAKVFPEISADDVRTRAMEIAAASDLKIEISVRRISSNIFELSSAK
jgi:surface carbohydrate biosynthesis protein